MPRVPCRRPRPHPTTHSSLRTSCCRRGGRLRDSTDAHKTNHDIDIVSDASARSCIVRWIGGRRALGTVSFEPEDFMPPALRLYLTG
eukprot:1915141-Pyramimonas_sp.AAC.1